MGGRYQPFLVAVSILIAALASYTALELAGSVAGKQGRRRAAWLAGGSITLGIGIWSMHFVGMLAFHIPGVQIGYHFGLVVTSVVIAIVASAMAMVTVAEKPSTAAIIAAGIAMSVAIAGMHYTGMAAIRAPVHIDWNNALVAASIAVALVASFLALYLAMHVSDTSSDRLRYTKLGGAVILGVAIAGMHYTAMAASSFTAVHAVMTIDTAGLVAREELAAAVSAGTLLILGIAMVGSHLSTRQQMEQRIKQSEEYYRSIIENASDIIVVIDSQGRRMYASPSYKRILGYDPNELLGGDAYQFTHPDDIADARSYFHELLSKPGTTIPFKGRAQHADGSWRTLRVFGQNLLANPAVRGIVLTAHDETERIKLEEQFRQAQKMEAVGRLAGGIAHDFNNLLTVIDGNVHLLTEESNSSPAIRNGLKQIGEAATRAAGLTRQLLAFSRRQILQPRTFALNDIPTGMLGMLQRLLGEDVTVNTQLVRNSPTVRADPNQIEQVFMNLAVNARDSMPHGGTITISTRIGNAPGREFHTHDAIPAGTYAILEMHDTGTGIDAETMGRIFEPFFTTKELGKGTGLGLATVYGIMQQSGGHIAVRSVPGEGTTFMLLFPPARDDEDAAESTLPAPLSTAGSETILLVEDEGALRSLVTRVLERKGYGVIACPDGESALEWCRSNGCTFDLVIADVVLPGISGREVVEKLTEQRGDLQVLYTSGYNEDEILHRGVMRDQTHFLEKPFTPGDLLQKVRTVLLERPLAEKIN